MDSLDVTEPSPASEFAPEDDRDSAEPMDFDEVVARRRLPKWPFVLAALLFLVGVGIAVAWPINVPYYALSPGPVNDTTDFVSVADPVGVDDGGELYFLTVSLREINAMEYVGALLDGEVDVSPRENIRPAGITPERLREQNLEMMENSKDNAIYVALTELGYDPTLDGSGAQVTQIIAGSAADGVLMPGDLVVAIDGEPVEFSTDAVELVGGHPPGVTITITVERTDEDGEVETLELPVTLTPFRFDEADGTVQEDPERGMVGVLLLNGPTTVHFPIDVTIDSQNIGGPSAGLMFTLEVINQLTEEDITRGHRIAGTGTMDADGHVGAIGGAKQKVFAAIDLGAEYVLVPAGNYEDAVDAAGDDIEVVRVETIDDALAFLDTLDPA